MYGKKKTGRFRAENALFAIDVLFGAALHHGIDAAERRCCSHDGTEHCLRQEEEVVQRRIDERSLTCVDRIGSEKDRFYNHELY